jgi:hypothetical protein
MNKVISECEMKMDRLFEYEGSGKYAGVTENARGGYFFGEVRENLYYVSFGANKHDQVILLKSEFKEVSEFLAEHGYIFYDEEDTLVYVEPTDDRHFLKYRKALPGPALDKDEAIFVGDLF